MHRAEGVGRVGITTALGVEQQVWRGYQSLSGANVEQENKTMRQTHFPYYTVGIRISPGIEEVGGTEK